MIHNSPSIGLTKYGTGNKVPSNQGLFGGYPGPASFHEIAQETNIYDVIASGSPLPYTVEAVPQLLEIKGEYYTGHTTSAERALKTGDLWAGSSHGGGAGLGDPLERDPRLIAKDIENKVATLEVAQKVYAVAINPKTSKIDYEKTEILRAERRKQRLEQGIPGIEYLKQLVRVREERQLPQSALDFLDETRNFCPAFEKELAREKEKVEKGLKPVGKVKARQKLFSLTPYVDIVVDDKGRKLAVCSQCGFAYCEKNDNFKLYCLIYEREPVLFSPRKAGLRQRMVCIPRILLPILCFTNRG